MTETKHWRLWVDGEERTDDCDHIDITTPRLVYDVPHDRRWQRRVLGPGGFSITVTNPSERLLALADDGEKVHLLKILVAGQALSVQVEFHMAWGERSGVRKMFGCAAVDRDGLPMWVTEPTNSEGQRPLTLATKEG